MKMLSLKDVRTKAFTTLLLILSITLISGTFLTTTAVLPVVLNPGFESPGGVAPTDPDHWYFTTTSDGPGLDDFTKFYPTAFPHNGAESAGILVAAAEPGDHAEWNQDSVSPVYAGSSYNHSAWVFLTGPPNLFVDIGVIWQDNVGTQLGSAFSIAVNLPQGVWFELFHTTGAAPAGTTQVQIVLRASVTGGDPITVGDVYFDDVQFYPIGETNLGGNTPGDHGSYFDPDADPYNEMLQINVTANNEGLTQINFTLQAFGTANDQTDIASVDLVYDQNGDGIYQNGTEPLLDSGIYSADNGTLQLNSGHTVPVGQSHAFLVVYQLTFTADAGETFGFNVTQIIALGQVSGLFVNLPGPPYVSAIKTMVGSLIASTGANSPGNHDWAPNSVTPNILLQLNLTAIGENFSVRNITIQFHGNGSLTHVIAVQVYKDLDNNGQIDFGEQLIGTGIGQSVQTITFNPTFLVQQGDFETILIALVLSSTAVVGSTYSISVIDVGAVGAIDSTGYVVNLPITSATKTIVAGLPFPIDPLLLLLLLVIIIVIILIAICLYRRRSRD